MMKVTEVNTMLKTFMQKQDESDKDIKENERVPQSTSNNYSSPFGQSYKQEKVVDNRSDSPKGPEDASWGPEPRLNA